MLDAGLWLAALVSSPVQLVGDFSLLMRFFDLRPGCGFVLESLLVKKQEIVLRNKAIFTDSAEVVCLKGGEGQYQKDGMF